MPPISNVVLLVTKPNMQLALLLLKVKCWLVPCHTSTINHPGPLLQDTVQPVNPFSADTWDTKDIALGFSWMNFP